MSITNTQIASLRNEAATAGDLDMVAIATLAEGGPDALVGAEPGTAFAELAERGMTQAEAITECERVIDDAAAMDDDE